jgi:hypothetical protein
MGSELEVASMLYHIATHCEDFTTEEIAEILKEAAGIICARFGFPASDSSIDLDDIEGSGNA